MTPREGLFFLAFAAVIFSIVAFVGHLWGAG